MRSHPQAPRRRCAPAAEPSPTTIAAASPDDGSITDIGVGFDTARYGHCAAFLDGRLQTAAPDLEVIESGAGYGKLRDQLVALVHQHGRVHFRVRVDAAGVYADNLLAFLSQLALDNARITVSVGDPQRNQNYRLAIFGQHKSDPVEAQACARFALTERPKASTIASTELARLRQVAGRLQALLRQRTRLVNQLHQLLARTFPELAMLVSNISTGWCLELLQRYPTVRLLAQAAADDLRDIPYLPHARIDELLSRARDSVASLDGRVMERLVIEQVQQVRDVKARQKRLENLLVSAYDDLPEANRLDTIPGVGKITAAILTAFILDINRFETERQLVKYFGTMPIEASSGFKRDGTPRGPRRYVMSPRGNDLVRRYLWMAALTAARYNPACRALYARVRAKHPQQPSIAIGHVMRKLLHLAFAIWKSGKPFDREHYPWHAPAHVAGGDNAMSVEGTEASSDNATSVNDQAAGLASGAEPVRQEVAAACAPTAAEARSSVECAGVWLDFAHLKRQLPLARVLDHLGLSAHLRGPGAQKRCACPIHRGDGRGRTFSVNLDDNVYQCFDAKCASRGDVIDLWAALRQLDVRAAALDLMHAFDLEPTLQSGTVSGRSKPPKAPAGSKGQDAETAC
jgi:transposase